MNSSIEYEGPELVIFEAARNWKTYFSKAIHPSVKGKVLEVGAGIGGVAKVICAGLSDGVVESWMCLEPDPGQSAIIAAEIENGGLPEFCRTMVGTVSDIQAKQKFDTILYIDVLEHIENDLTELAMAAEFLSPGGRLVVMSPAHPQLFSELDKAARHFRRYTALSLGALTPPDTKLVISRYYDCVGMIASLANRLMLRQGIPTLGQIHVWDRLMIPLSRLLDPVFAHRLGKSILTVWEKTEKI